MRQTDEILSCIIIILEESILTCGIQVVRTLAILNKACSIGMILSKCAIPSLTVSVTDIKILCGGTLWMCRMTNCSCIHIFM